MVRENTMKIKKRILFVLTIMTVISVILISSCQNSLVREISLGIISGNIVAIILVFLEYQNEKEKLLTDYVFEVTFLATELKENLNLKYLVIYFYDFLIMDKKENIVKLQNDFLLQSSNAEKVKDSINKIHLLKDIDTTKLARYSTNYHSLFSFNKKDTIRVELFELYKYIKDIINYLHRMSFNLNNTLDSTHCLLEQELLALLSLTKKIYTFKVDDNVMIAEDNLSYYLDTKIKK